MKIQTISNTERNLWIVAAILVLPAFLTNLGMMPFIDDEAIRALVAYEMELTGNYIAPTLNGAPYLNKPPLYNWILLGFFHLTGNFDEFSSRLATVVSCIGFGLSIFLVFRKHLGARVALFTAFFFLTCGRVLLYDSLLGLIDICYSWFTFLGFYSVYYFFHRKNWYALFLVSYGITAAGFMMKGLPSIVFQGSTLLAFLIWKRSWKKLFSLPHIAGGALFLLLVGFYYYLYSQQQPVEDVLLNLFNESTKRTATEHGFGNTILHIFTFPFEMVYHFLPWSLLSILFISRTVRQKLRENEFIQFLLILFFVNIIPYWLSVEVYPRYILMLAPLYFGALAWLIEQHLPIDGPHRKWLEWLFKILMLFVIAMASIPLWWDQTPRVTFHLYKSVFLLASLLILGIFYWREKELRVPIMVLVLLVGRLGFDWFILPDRLSKDWGQVCKLSTIEAVGKADSVPVIYENTGFQQTNSFYASLTAEAIIYRKMSGFEEGDLIIFDPEVYIDFDFEEIDYIFLRFKKREQLLARFQGYNELRED